MKAAVSGSSKDSRSITGHQWTAEYPTESRIGRSSARARPSASSPHGYQSTGFSACCRRYGLVSVLRRFTSARRSDSRAILGGGRAARREIDVEEHICAARRAAAVRHVLRVLPVEAAAVEDVLAPCGSGDQHACSCRVPEL